MLGPNRFSPPLAAGMRTSLLGLLLLLAGLFWAWTQAHAAPAHLLDASDDETVYWAMADVEGEDIEPGESALSPARDLICRKPAPYKPRADKLLNEMADQDLPSCVALWMTLPNGIPAQGPQPVLSQAEREPLLRPPARLG